MRIIVALLLCVLAPAVVAQSFPAMLQVAKEDGAKIDKIIRTANIKLD